MIIESLDEYIETLSGFIFDDDKLVTYKFLSKELEVHVNIAKQILWEFSQRLKDTSKFECTYLLMGTLKNGGMRVEVVKEENLLEAKKKFSNIISEHIYSIQKALPDIELLATSGDGDVKYSAVCCKDNLERTDEEMHLLRWGRAANNVQQVAQQEKKPAQLVSKPTAEAKVKTPEKKDDSSKKDSGSKKNNQIKGTNNLFGGKPKQKTSPSNTAKKEIQTSNGTKRISPPKPSSSAATKKKVQKGGLSSFLIHGANQAKPATNSNKEKKEEERSVEGKPQEERKTSLEEKKIAKETLREEKPAETSKQRKEKRGKKRNRSKEDSTAAKRRKRIAVQSDSSDSGSCDEEEDEIPPSPPPAAPSKPRTPSPPRVKHEDGKRKILKKVDKTFQEDGYLVTKKVHVYVSCSEEEDEIVEIKKPKELQKMPPKADTKAKKNTKQTMLTNFFKKPTK